MSKKIFKSIFFVSVLVLLASIIFIFGILYDYFSSQYEKSLKSEAVCVSAAVEMNGVDYLENLEADNRITLIKSDGTVIYDSKADASQLENHLDREEVSTALKTGEGISERYSKTQTQKTVNVALRLDNGNVLRVSGTRYTVITLVFALAQPICIVVVLAVVLSIILALRLSKKIIQPINNIDIENPDKTENYEEIRPLLNKISKQNRQIKRQMEEIENEHDNKDKIRSEFTANVSHELKTPLTSISGFAEIIRDGIVTDEKDINKFAGNIYKESQRLITLVEDIIKLSELEGNSPDIKKEEIDLYEICENVMDYTKTAAEAKNIKIRLDGEKTLMTGSVKLIEEMVYNLCDNAIKYNNPGGYVEVSVKKDECHAILSIKDNGIGISEDDRARVFERFYRVNKSRSKEFGGTGLGLSIVKHGAIFHNAKIELESEPGKGTEIKIIFNCI